MLPPPVKVLVEPKTNIGLPLEEQVRRTLEPEVWVMGPFQVAVPALAFRYTVLPLVPVTWNVRVEAPLKPDPRLTDTFALEEIPLPSQIFRCPPARSVPPPSRWATDACQTPLPPCPVCVSLRPLWMPRLFLPVQLRHRCRRRRSSRRRPQPSRASRAAGWSLRSFSPCCSGSPG